MSDGQPHDTFAFVATAIPAIWLNRRAMFNGEDGMTEVICKTAGAGMPHNLGSGTGAGP
jgi:hypothetical protein